MGNFIELIKVFVIGIVEGITEWLPISSTGHMLLFDEFLKINIGPNPDIFSRLFIDVIQLGAILAVVFIFWHKMWPFGLDTNKKPVIKKDIFSMWFKVVVACIPGAIATILCKDQIDKYLNTPFVIAAALIVYGIAFIIIEDKNKNKNPSVQFLSEITYKHAFLIGLFQVLSIIPGTSRSGSTIIGALLIGVSRKAAAEFTFFLAVPVMFGLSAIELLGYILDFGITVTELFMLGFGMLVAFAVSLIVIKFLMNYIRKHDFKVFGWYRIILGIIVIIYFSIFAK
jgi:undecaprenyl-diphosphatase